MLKNYFKIAIRNLFRNKSFSLINIGGLAVGMASAMLIILFVQNEINYDRFHTNTDRLYQVWTKEQFGNKIQCAERTPGLTASVLKQDFPEIENVSSNINWGLSLLFTIDNKHAKAVGMAADPAFLSLFTFPLIKGDIHSALNSVYSIVITEQLAKKLFGDADPMGKTIKLDNSDNVTVTGILKDLPDNTRFAFEYLVSWQYMQIKGWTDSSWLSNSVETFVLLKPNVDVTKINSKIKNLIQQHTSSVIKTEIFLYPLKNLWLYSEFENGKPAGGRIVIVRVFSIIAIVILLIACINFMNLSTAHSIKRARETGIRKTIGARRLSLITQFLLESIIIAFIAGMLAILVVQLSINPFNLLIGHQLSIAYYKPIFWLVWLGFIIFTGLIAGSYPAFYLSSFPAADILKRKLGSTKTLIAPRKVLVVIQFSFAIMLIISTMIISKQIKYGQDRKTGYQMNNLIYLPIEGNISKNYTLIKNDLLSTGAAVSVSKTSSPLTENWSTEGNMVWEGKDATSNLLIDRLCTDGDLINTAGMKLISGRDIDALKYPTDSTACLLNESAVKIMGFKSPIGQVINDVGTNWHVVGVIQDFILQSPFQSIRPMIIEGPKSYFFTLNIRLNPANTLTQNLTRAESIFKKYNAEYPFIFHFTDTEYAYKFNNEKITNVLISLFTWLTIFISCLGLFGLASYTTENRRKEISIRKVLGASISRVILLISREFISLVLISFIIAAPVAFFIMNNWLQGYTYRIVISWEIFAFTACLVICITFATISYQIIKSALTNPVKNLRSE